MNKLFGIVVLGVVLAILKAAAVVLTATLLLSLVFAFIRRPGDTLLFLASLVVLGLATAQPLACIITLGVIGVVLVVADARRSPGASNHGREHHWK